MVKCELKIQIEVVDSWRLSSKDGMLVGKKAFVGMSYSIYLPNGSHVKHTGPWVRRVRSSSVSAETGTIESQPSELAALG